MTDTNNTADLEGLRAQLDEMDGRLLRTVHDRIKLCIQIAEYKRDHNVPMMQPQRIEAVHEHAAAFAADHGIDRVRGRIPGAHVRRLPRLHPRIAVCLQAGQPVGRPGRRSRWRSARSPAPARRACGPRG